MVTGGKTMAKISSQFTNRLHSIFDYFKKRKWYYIGFVLVSATSIILGKNLPQMQIIQQPDRALAFFALFWVLSQWCQNYTGLHGVTFISARDQDQITMRFPKPNTKGWFRMSIKFGYWVSMILMLFLVFQLALGTIREVGNDEKLTIIVNELRQSNIELKNSNLKMQQSLDELIQSNIELKQSNEDTQEMLKDLIILITQNTNKGVLDNVTNTDNPTQQKPDTDNTTKSNPDNK